MRRILDRFLKLSIGKQLLALAVLLFIIGVAYFYVGMRLDFTYAEVSGSKLDTIVNGLSEAEGAVKEPTLGEKAIYIFSRLMDPGYIGDSKDGIATSILSVLGWMLCGGFFIAILTNGYFERIKKIEMGTVRYGMKNHIIIFGNNDMTMGIIRTLRSEGGENTKSNIVVFTSEDAMTVRKKYKAYLNKKEEKNLHIYHGDRGSFDHLKELSLADAHSIYVLGEKAENGVDSRNINCVKLISDVIHLSKDNKKQEKISCYLLLDNLTTFDLLQHNSMEERIKQVLDVKTFNLHQTWATKVFSNECISKDQDYTKIYSNIEKLSRRDVADYDEDTLRFVIIGFNRMGKVIMNQAARVLHFGHKRKIVLTVMDKKAKALEDQFKALHPGWNDIPDVKFEFIECDIISLEARKLLTEWAVDKQLLSIAICLRNPDTALYAGLNLPGEIYTEKTPVLVRQEELHGFTKSINDDGRYSEVVFFGMIDDVVKDNHAREKVAKEIHDNYVAQNKKKENKGGVMETEWSELPESYKWANRYALDNYPVKHLALQMYSKLYAEDRLAEYSNNVEALHFADISINDFSNMEVEDMEREKVKREEGLRARIEPMKWEELQNLLTEAEFVSQRSLISEDLELLAEIEHNRWCGERVIGKWAYSEERCDERLHHPCIVKYDKLSGELKNYDRDNVVMFLNYLSNRK